MRHHTATIEGVPDEAADFEFALMALCYGTNVSGQTGEQRYGLSVR